LGQLVVLEVAPDDLRGDHRRPDLRIINGYISFGRGDRGMPEQHLDSAEVAAAARPGVASVQKNATGAAVVDLAGSTGCSEASGRA
jgi:hypothetical protein